MDSTRGVFLFCSVFVFAIISPKVVKSPSRLISLSGQKCVFFVIDIIIFESRNNSRDIVTNTIISKKILGRYANVSRCALVWFSSESERDSTPRERLAELSRREDGSDDERFDAIARRFYRYPNAEDCSKSFLSKKRSGRWYERSENALFCPRGERGGSSAAEEKDEVWRSK